MTGSILLAAILAIAWLTGVLTFFVPEHRTTLRNALNLGAALGKLALVGLLLLAVQQGQAFELSYPLLPGIELLLHADAWTLLFLTLSTLLWLLTTVYAVGYLADSPHRSRFFGFFGLCVGATAGIALAGNLLTFLVFYELLTLATYPLVVHRGSAESLRAGRKYLAYTLGGGAVLLAGVVWLRTIAGPLDFAAAGVLSRMDGLDPGTLRGIFFLLIAGLGVKAALVPLHGWLPSAMVAPAPVSALLHAVAVVKAGAFGIARVLYDVYGIEFAASLGVTTPLAVAAAVTILYGSLRAMYQDSLKRRLAFSTVSQVSYIALGSAIAGPLGTVGGIIHLVHQGLMKITLFFCAGNLEARLGIHRVSEMNGAGRRMPWTMAAFTVASLGMIGVPPMAGFISKWYLGAGAAEAGAHWAIAVLAASSLLNALYFLPTLYLAWFRPPGRQSSRREAPPTLLLPPMTTAAIALGVGVLAAAPLSPLTWAQLIAVREYAATGFTVTAAGRGHLLMLAALLAPLLAAAVAAMPRRKRLSRRLLPWTALPALVLAVTGDPGESLHLPWLLTGTVLELDRIGRGFLGFTAAVWLAAGTFAVGYLRADAARSRFAGFFQLAMAGNFGLILATGPVAFLAFFTLMSLSSYGLVVHRGDEPARAAARVYVVLAIAGEVCVYAALVAGTAAPWPATGTWTVALLIAGFGIKAGLLPLHVWLPLAHPVAPAPASAVLSGAMVAAGLVGWIRFLPLGVPEAAWAGPPLAILGVAGACYAAVAGTLQRDAKTVLAYSTVSQLGLMTAGMGAALGQPALVPALLPAIALYALHHGLAKGALFLASALVPGTRAARPVQWLTWAALLLPALAICGAPLTSGAVAKAALKSALGPGAPAELAAWLTAAAVGSSLLMARFVWLARPGSAPAAGGAPASMWAGWLASVLLTAGAVWWLPGAGAAVDKALAASALAGQLWPLGLGVAVWAALQVTLPAPAWQRLPRGDLLVPLAAAGAGLARRSRAAPVYVAAVYRRVRALSHAGAALALRPVPALSRAADAIESGSGLAFAATLVLLLVALALF